MQGCKGRNLSMFRKWRICLWIWAYECGRSLYHTVLFVVLSCMYPFVSICTEVNLAPWLTLHISDMPFRLFHWKLAQTAHCFVHFFPSPLFHLAMECLMWGVKKSCRVKHCSRAALWYAPSPNLILAVLKIVCVPGRTDRPLFSREPLLSEALKTAFVRQ